MSKSSTKYWLLQLLFWGGYWLLNVIFVAALGYSTVSTNLIFLWLSLSMCVFTHGLRGVYRRYFYQKTLAFLIVQLLWLLPLAAVLIQALLFGVVYIAIAMQPSVGQGLDSASTGRFLVYSINTCIMLVLWSLIYLFRAEWLKRRQTEREHWENQLKLREMELQFLRSQINSHFLFNALNNIRALILEDVEAARQGLNDLATLLRGLMVSEDKTTVSLREEIEWVKGYLALEALQFEQRLHYELNMNDAVLDAQLPPLLLQTLVENAIKHGIARRRQGGTIYISAQTISPTQWQLRVENPEPDLPPKHEGHGIGLRNLKSRLKSVFGDKAHVELQFSSTIVATAVLPL